ncbi:unnamed protein product, partial [Musa textilis]
KKKNVRSSLLFLASHLLIMELLGNVDMCFNQSRFIVSNDTYRLILMHRMWPW